MAVPFVGSLMKSVFGTRNDRMVKTLLEKVTAVNTLEPGMRALSDAELRAKTAEFRRRFADGETIRQLMPEAFAVAREAMDRSVGIRNVFNPEHGFDPSALPEDMRALYEETRRTIEETPGRGPVDDLRGCEDVVPSWMFVDIPTPLYDAVRALYPQSKPPFRARPFDVQIIGGTVLSEGRIAEMRTGEGKTIVAPLAAYLAAIQEKATHVVTVNDYLVQRDRDWTFPFFRAVGLTVGAIHPMHMQSPQAKAVAYSCDVVYGTTSEFGFDYLRDNMKLRAEEQFQKRHDFAIVDEVDSILIDEARTPLIISGPAHQHSPRYELADRLARHLVERQGEWNAANEAVESCRVDISGVEGDIRNTRDKDRVPEMRARMEEAKKRLPELESIRDRHVQYYEVELDKKRTNLTDDGIAEAQRAAGVGSFYVGENVDMPHLLEQSLRAHTVYQRDRDYVVAPDDQGEAGVVIVDQNTGRKMVGRQWSDGLHQAVEAKEGVKIKEETQTMATITIQKFFKLYDRLAGMTGTADTEATEFHEIYRLDVIAIPTNVPIQRADRNDFVFPTTKDKWKAIVEEIRDHHDVGRPVLVGTTSVEKSEMLSSMLTRETRIQHEVLNAKQHDREADIVLGAGRLGAVMIATNMAGRGTDIKLARIDRADLIDHWKRRDLCPKVVRPEMSDDEILEHCYRHMAVRRLGLEKAAVDAFEPGIARSRLLCHWTGTDESKIPSDPQSRASFDEKLVAMLDRGGYPPLHRLELWSSIEDMGGLHIVGTERHESRRIDNQLRGRAGRQGDNGSSRFFLSLEDDLMKMFAGKKVNALLAATGFKEGDTLESPMLTKAVARAQRKVEERNFQWRKNILEYDEPMDFQRREFYAMRQAVLENRGIKEVIFEFIEESAEDAVETYLSPSHAGNCISEWVNERYGITIEADRFKGKDREDLHALISRDALDEAASVVNMTATEYLGEDHDPDQVDWDGLARWANATFEAGTTADELRVLDRRGIVDRIVDGARRTYAAIDLSPLDQYLVPDFGRRELVRWVNRKFATELEPDAFDGLERGDGAVDHVIDVARKAYRERELSYPIEFALEVTQNGMQQDPQNAIRQFAEWVNARYDLNWSPQALPESDPAKLRELLVGQAHRWDAERIRERANKALATAKTPAELDAWFRTNARVALTERELEEAEGDMQGFTERRLAEMLRAELTQFERWILLQIFDTCWKDHLHQMDQTRESIGFRAFSQRDPRIEFKREAARLFDDMRGTIRDRVTDIVLKGRLSPQQQPAQQQAQQRAAQEAAAAQQRTSADDGGDGGAATATAPPRPAKAEGSVRAVARMAQGDGEGGEAGRPAIGRNEIVRVRDPKGGGEETMKYRKARKLIEEKGWTLVG